MGYKPNAEMKVNCDFEKSHSITFCTCHSGLNIEIGDDLILLTDKDKVIQLRDFLCDYLDECWIDINEKQPEPWQSVLVHCEGGNIITCKYYGEEVCKSSSLGSKNRAHFGKYGRWFEAAERGYVVTHWMTLPSKPVSE